MRAQLFAPKLTMHTIFAFLGVAVLHCAAVSIPAGTPQEVGLDPARIKVLDEYLHGYVKPDKDGVRQLAGTTVALARDGKLVHLKADGDQDIGKVPMSEDTIFRLYSMTKPMTAVALMTFWEHAKFNLDDPVSLYIPAFKNMRVLRTPSSTFDDTVPAERPISIRHLLTHTSGLSYGTEENAVDKFYRDNNVGTLPSGWNGTGTLADWVNGLAKAPLLFQPGTRWHYSMSIDVCGALIEALSAEPLHQVFQKRILDPLGMTDTGFVVPKEKLDRFSPNYLPPNSTQPYPVKSHDQLCLTLPRAASGGGGLCSTTKDYLRFAMMLANYGALGVVRVLAPRTVRLLAANNVEGGVSLKTLGSFPGDMWSKTSPTSRQSGTIDTWGGVGQGLGGQMIIDPVRLGMATGKGMYLWGGAAGTLFTVDFEENLVMVYMQQRADAGPPEIASHLRTLVQACIADELRIQHLEV